MRSRTIDTNKKKLLTVNTTWLSFPPDPADAIDWIEPTFHPHPMYQSFYTDNTIRKQSCNHILD